MPVVLSIELCSGAYWGKAPVVAVDVVSYTLGLYSIIGMEYSFILFTMPKQKYPVLNMPHQCIKTNKHVSLHSHPATCTTTHLLYAL